MVQAEAPFSAKVRGQAGGQPSIIRDKSIETRDRRLVYRFRDGVQFTEANYGDVELLLEAAKYPHALDVRVGHRGG